MATKPWRLAKSLETLRSQVNAAYPKRSKVSDGTIGDDKHAATKSEHNRNAAGVVQAMDITHDPKGGFNSYDFAERLRQNRDPRIMYVISNGRIFSSTKIPWQWRTYTGANRHDHHVHISVADGAALYDDPRPWAGVAVPAQAVPPAPSASSGGTATTVSSKVPAQILAAARASQAKWGVPASIVIAQWALESGWGSSTPKGSNNPFGIKAVAGQAGVKATTTEVVHGSTVVMDQTFASYPSLDAAFEAHGKLLATRPQYAPAMAVRGDPRKFAAALTGVYATDPAYGTKLWAIITQHNLTAADVMPGPAAPVPVPTPSVIPVVVPAPIVEAPKPAPKPAPSPPPSRLVEPPPATLAASIWQSLKAIFGR